MKPNPKIVNLLKEADGADKSQIVSIYENIKNIGIEDRLCQRKQLPIKSVGVHRMSRDGLGASGHEAHNVGNTVDTTGYHPSACEDATCFADGPDRS